MTDDRDLRFSEIKQIIRNASEGKLENVTEKLDGINLVYTVTSDKKPKAARSSGDISRGGMSAEELAKKFQGRGTLTNAFTEAFEVLEQAFSSLSDEINARVFDDGKRWYSMEIVYSANPNVISYDDNHVVFHTTPVFQVGQDGKVSAIEDTKYGWMTAEVARRAAESVKKIGWSLHGPLFMNLRSMADGSAADEAIVSIEEVQRENGFSDENTIGDLIEKRVSEAVDAMGLSDATKKQVIARVMEVPSAPTLTQVKKGLDPAKYAQIKAYVDASGKAISSAVMPIERIIHKFATQFLRGVNSLLVRDASGELNRLKYAVHAATKEINQSGTDDEKAIVKKQLEKLGSIENIISALEGIVFTYGGKAYKFTGSFAPVNQILGVRRYKRG